MQINVKDIPEGARGEAFDYTQPIHCELSEGLPEGGELLRSCALPLLGGAFVASFEATDAASVTVEVTEDGREWREADSLELVAGNRVTRSYTFEPAPVLARFYIKALRALKRVDIYSQVR